MMVVVRVTTIVCTLLSGFADACCSPRRCCEISYPFYAACCDTNSISGSVAYSVTCRSVLADRHWRAYGRSTSYRICETSNDLTFVGCHRLF